MVNLTKLSKQPVYFGHPSQFWMERQRLEMKATVDVESMKKLSDVVDYDFVHLQKLVENRTSEKVQQLLDEEEKMLLQRRERLKLLLDSEEEQYMEEIRRKKEREECSYCKDKKKKTKEYLDETEKEKLRACLKALEREKIAKGMQCTKVDEKQLKEMQKLQMLEKMNIEEENHNIDMMWHHLLIEDVRAKEQKEREDEHRRQQEMLERRRAYDEQIASANKKRQDAIREEREKENRRLERMKKKMEQDHFEAIKRKKEQQKMNSKNFIEGHKEKLTKLRLEKIRAREIDDGTIRAALDGLERERERKRIQLRNLQVEKKLFVDYQNRERQQVSALEEEADRIAQEWKREAEEKSDELMRKLESEKRAFKEQAVQEYQAHLANMNKEVERAKVERRQIMEQVKREARNELKTCLENAKDELRRQIEYRNNLTNQIKENQRALESELISTELKDKPFTKKANSFKDALENILQQKNVARESTNPVHPFKKRIDKEVTKIRLPQLY